jgi:hypothetical protein
MRRVFFLFLFLFLMVGKLFAEPCLLIYPLQSTVFRFDPFRYQVVTDTDPRYDPLYDRSGKMLWDLVDDRVAYEVYQAPNLQGFMASATGRSEYFVTKWEVDLAVDGFYSQPRRLNDIFVRFQPIPSDALLDITVNGHQLTNYRHFIPALSVQSAVHSSFYSDTASFTVNWLGAKQIIVTAFADKDGNGVYNGEPCFNVLLEDPYVPALNTTWGQIKAIYKE